MKRRPSIIYTFYKYFINNNNNIERFHLPRNYGGRGIISVHTLNYNQIKKLRILSWKDENINFSSQYIIDRRCLRTPQKNYKNIRSKKEVKGETLNGKYIESSEIDTKASQKWNRMATLFNPFLGKYFNHLAFQWLIICSLQIFLLHFLQTCLCFLSFVIGHK